MLVLYDKFRETTYCEFNQRRKRELKRFQFINARDAEVSIMTMTRPKGICWILYYQIINHYQKTKEKSKI